MKDTSTVTLTIAYDNNEYDLGLETAWGFSCCVRATEKTILFDTGGDGKKLLLNMGKLNIEPQEVEAVVLSHIHRDHLGGLPPFLDENPNVVVYLPHSLPERRKDEIKRYGAQVVSVNKPLQISRNLYSTGELGNGIREQSLLINTDAGLIVITGCAHPGIVKVIQKARDVLKSSIYLALGGFHLKDMKEKKINKVIERLKKEGIKRVGPCHCSGRLAMKLFKRAYGKDFLQTGVGTSVRVPSS